MRRSKHIYRFWIWAAALLWGCVAAKTDFRESEAQGPGLYSHVLSDTCHGAKGGPETIREIRLYKTSFNEGLVEMGSVLGPASLNDSDRQKPVEYKTLIGYRQDMYLVKVTGTCHPDAWFYFSIWYRPAKDRPVQEQFGLGKAYMGFGNPSDFTIHFTHRLNLQGSGNGHYLAFGGNADTAQFFFVTAEPRLSDPTVRVSRIVIEERNKFGGPNAFVFHVADHFEGRMDELIFRRIGIYQF